MSELTFKADDRLRFVFPKNWYWSSKPFDAEELMKAVKLLEGQSLDGCEKYLANRPHY